MKKIPNYFVQFFVKNFRVKSELPIDPNPITEEEKEKIRKELEKIINKKFNTKKGGKEILNKGFEIGNGLWKKYKNGENEENNDKIIAELSKKVLKKSNIEIDLQEILEEYQEE